MFASPNGEPRFACTLGETVAPFLPRTHLDQPLPSCGPDDDPVVITAAYEVIGEPLTPALASRVAAVLEAHPAACLVAVSAEAFSFQLPGPVGEPLPAPVPELLGWPAGTVLDWSRADSMLESVKAAVAAALLNDDLPDHIVNLTLRTYAAPGSDAVAGVQRTRR